MLDRFGQFFGFSRRELNGLILLAVILFVLWLLPYIYAIWKTDNPVDLHGHIHEIESFLAAAKREATPTADLKHVPSVTDRQIRTIKNYSVKETSQSVSVTPNATFSERTLIEPTAHKNLHLELNTVDSVELQYLPGIGPVFGSRIIRFRDRLGGFHHISQLLDVYGFDSLRFDGLKAYVYVDTARIIRIPVNTADYEQLKNHPLISPKLANAIVQYRRQHGPYQTLEELLNIVILDDAVFAKLAPYLSIAGD